MSAVAASESLSPPELPHSLVALRPITRQDLSGWATYLNLPSVYEQTSWNFPTELQLAKHVWNPEASISERMVRFAIAERAADTLVGTIGFHTFQPDDNSAEISYDLAPRMWGKGIATAACKAMVDWGFRRLSYVRVRAAVLEENVRSVRVLENCDFQFVGAVAAFREVRGNPRTFNLYEKRSSELAHDAA
jgi:ribosomal-protein-alanine N-acetyltransferase